LYQNYSHLPKNPRSKERGFFYPSRRLGISSPHEVRRISSRAPCALASHQPLWGWILLRLDDIQRQAVDDIPQQVAGDIQGLRLDLFTKVWYNLTDKSEYYGGY